MDDEQKFINVGVLTYLGTIMLIGGIGNAFVSYIYYFKLNPTATNLFVSILSLCDLFGCIFCIPLDIIVVLFPYDFPSDVGCRIIRFVVMDVIVISAFVVFAVSVDRFIKVVLAIRKEMKRHQINYICIAIAVASTILSLPCLHIYSIREVKIPGRNVTGQQCTLSKGDDKGTSIYIGLLILIWAFLFVLMCTIYCLIGIKLCRYKNEHQSQMNSFGESISEVQTISTSTDSCDYIKGQQHFEKIQKSKALKENYINSAKMRSRLQCSATDIRLDKTFLMRTTLIMFLISLCWVVSFIPHLAAVVLLIVKRNIKYTLGNTGRLLLDIALRSFYFNNAINPFIYGIFNFRFRWELFSLLRKATCR